MLGESQLNVYIVGASLTPRQRQRLQAQLQTAMRSLPAWALDLLGRRLQELGATHFPLIVEPQTAADSSPRPLGLGHIDGRPAVRLMPRLRADAVDWRQDQRYLVAKAVAYLAAPPPSDGDFWARWAAAVDRDGLREKALEVSERWTEASDLGLLMEMFAACALNPQHSRWSQLPSVRAFLEEWAGGTVDR